uniref:Laminin EGF-like domain-containing protein n=1 Tax=Tetranychus urticae TaxID=32264 RepID=T1JRW9_TETUR
MASLTKSIFKFMAGSKPHRNKFTSSSSTNYQDFFFAFIFVNILCFISLTFLTTVSAVTSPESEESNSVDCSPNDPNFPLCRHCPCNRAGVLDPENCDEPCECKPSVIGQFCDQCKPGYVNLNSDNPEGCTKCFCFNVTTSCRITYWPSQIITNPADWQITTLSGGEIVDPQQEDDHLVIADDDAPSAPYYYWSAPREYLGDMYAAYGRKAKISLSATVLRGDSAGSPVYGPDIVLEGEDSQGSRLLIGHSWKPIPFVRAERTKINRKIVLSERNWFRLNDDGSNSSRVTRDEFVMVLSNLKL